MTLPHQRRSIKQPNMVYFASNHCSTLFRVFLVYPSYCCIIAVIVTKKKWFVHSPLSVNIFEYILPVIVANEKLNDLTTTFKTVYQAFSVFHMSFAPHESLFNCVLKSTIQDNRSNNDCRKYM